MTAHPPFPPSRRTFLGGVGATSGVLTLLPARALANPDAWHVAYPGTTTNDEAQEFIEQLVEQMGPDVAKKLSVVMFKGQPTVVYDRSHLSYAADKARVQPVVDRHNEILQTAFDSTETFAIAIRAGELKVSYNIRYGEPTTREGLEPRWEIVSSMLGPGVAKALVIEQLSDETHQLVYRRLGDQESTAQVARHHSDLLRKKGIEAVATPDGYLPIVADGSTTSTPTVAATKAKSESAGLRSATSTLSAEINTYIKGLRQKGQVSGVERTSWLVYDLEADQTLAAINADLPRQAASMIKPYVALAFMHEVARGRLSYGPRSRGHHEKMIQVSNNPSTNWMMEQVGSPSKVNQLLHSNYGELVKHLRVVERIPSNGRTYRNLASMSDHGRFLRALWFDRLPQSKELKRVMNLPGSDRLYRGVPEIPTGTAVYNKTGTTARCCGDMGILVARKRDGGRYPYILAAVIDRTESTSSYTSWQRQRSNVIRGVSGLVYRWLRERHGLA